MPLLFAGPVAAQDTGAPAGEGPPPPIAPATVSRDEQGRATRPWPTGRSTSTTLVGVEIPAQSMNLEFTPYAASSLTTDRAARVPFENDMSASAGIDVKYGVTRSLTADLTVNTDFAHVEEDQQQINLTRFNLFFPEKARRRKPFQS